MTKHYEFVPGSAAGAATVAEAKIEALPTSVHQVSGVNQTWSWKRPKWHGTKSMVKTYSRRATIDEIFSSIKKDAECIFQHFDRSCFGAYRRVAKGGSLCSTAFHFVMSMEITLSGALDDEMWFRIGDVNIRFSRVEFALVTGLRFGNASFDPTAIHTPPSTGIHQRLFNGSEVTVNDIFMKFTAGEFEGCSPLDRVKIIKILFLYYQLMGVDDRSKVVEKWVWTLVENDATWDDFPWGLYSYQFLLQYLKAVCVDEEISYHVRGNISAFLCWAYEAIPLLAAVCAKRLLLPRNQMPRALWWKFLRKRKLKFESLKFDEFPCIPMLKITPEEAKCYHDWWPAVHLQNMSQTSLLRKGNRTRAKRKKKAEKESSNAVVNKSVDETRVGMSIRKRVSKKKKEVQVSEISPSGNSEGNEAKLPDTDTAAPLIDPMSGLKGEAKIHSDEAPSSIREEVSSVIERLDNNSILTDSVVNEFEKCLGAMERASAEVVRSMKDGGLESTIKDPFKQEIGASGVTMEATEKTQHAVSMEEPRLEKLNPIMIEQEIIQALEEKVLSLEKQNDALKQRRVLDNKVINELNTKQSETEKLRECHAKAERALKELRSDLEIERKFSSSIVEGLKREKLEADVMLKELEKEIDFLKRSESERKRSGNFGADVVRAFQEDGELCIQAVCEFYSHAMDSECSNRRFYHFEKFWPHELADYLIQGDPKMPRPIAEVKRRFPHVVDICRQLAIEYSSYFIAMPRTLSVSLVCRHCCVLTDIHDVGACETSEDTCL